MTQSPATIRADLIQLSASEMARRIAAGTITSRELIDAHIRRIAQVNPALNAVVAERFDLARSEADAADQARARGEPLGPLHGVPITIKECFHVAGMASTEGIHRFADELLTHHNPLVGRLRRAGAIVLGKTNLPQLMLMHETDNPIYGRTNNPWNLQRGPGGSSGGEAAIIAAGGSPLGLGNDIGGSIRFPAHSCGICGIKPTTLRLTNAAVRDNLRGMEAIRPQSGPLARTVEDLTLALRVLCEPEPGVIDPQVAPVPLGDPAMVSISQLRIGMWTDDGHFPPAPALCRAVEESAAALRALGAQVVNFHPPDVPRAVDLFFQLTSADGGADVLRLLGDSPRDWRVGRMLLICRMPRFMRRGLAGVVQALGQPRTARFLRTIGRSTTDEYWQLSAARSAYAEQFFGAWNKARLDAVICPPHALPALRHGSTADLTVAASYCIWANVLGLPAGVVPVTRVGSGEETDRLVGRDNFDRAAYSVELGSAGLPVGVQVAAAPWREDIVLAVMSALESQFRGTSTFPATPVSPPPDTQAVR